MGSAEMTEGIWGKNLTAECRRDAIAQALAPPWKLWYIISPDDFRLPVLLNFLFFIFPCSGLWGKIARKIQIRDRGYECRR